MERPRMRFRGPVLDADDGLALAEFYEKFLGWTIAERAGTSEYGWAKLEAPDGLLKMEFQGDQKAYVRPVWPTVPDEQQMMIHLDFMVEDLEAAVAWAIECGATVAGHQPRPTVHVVMLDPEGHPFCLCRGRV